MPARVQAYCQRTDQPIPESYGQVVRCLLEGVALKYRWVLDRLERMQGKRYETIHIVGGGTQNKLLSQLAADATQRVVISGPVEATATGNLLVQAIALGELDSIAQAREVARQSFEVTEYRPNKPSAGQWDDAYARLNRLMGESC